MPPAHFDRLGRVSKTILAKGDRIVDSGSIVDAVTGARYLTVDHRNHTFRIYAYPHTGEMRLEALYRPSNILRTTMTKTDVEEYAEKAAIDGATFSEVKTAVVAHRLKSLYADRDVDEIYNGINEMNSLSPPRVIQLGFSPTRELRDGFGVVDALYPGEESFCVSRYERKVTRALDIKIDLAETLHAKIGFDNLDATSGDQEPDEPRPEVDSLGYA